MKSRIYIISVLIVCSLFGAGNYTMAKTDTVQEMKIKLIFGETVLTATMDDNRTSRNFISLLPLRVKFDDYANTEKITYLPGKLSTENAPKGYDPSVGDITYYAPWGNVAIFYRDFGYANGLIKLGKIDSGINSLQRIDNQSEVKIELMH